MPLETLIDSFGGLLAKSAASNMALQAEVTALEAELADAGGGGQAIGFSPVLTTAQASGALIAQLVDPNGSGSAFTSTGTVPAQITVTTDDALGTVVERSGVAVASGDTFYTLTGTWTHPGEPDVPASYKFIAKPDVSSGGGGGTVDLYSPYPNIYEGAVTSGDVVSVVPTVRQDVVIEIRQTPVKRLVKYYVGTRNGKNTNVGDNYGAIALPNEGPYLLFWPGETQKFVTLKGVLMRNLGDDLYVSLSNSHPLPGRTDNVNLNGGAVSFADIQVVCAAQASAVPVAIPQPTRYQPAWLAGRTPSLSADWTRDKIMSLVKGIPVDAQGVTTFTDQSGNNGGDRTQSSNQELGAYASRSIDGAPYVWNITDEGYLRISTFKVPTNARADGSGVIMPGRCCAVTSLGAFSLTDGCYRVRRKYAWNGGSVHAFWLMTTDTQEYGGVLYARTPEIDVTEFGLGNRPANASTIHSVPWNQAGQNPYNDFTPSVGMFSADGIGPDDVEEWYLEKTPDWISVGYSRDDGRTIETVAQFANVGPGKFGTGRHHIILNTTYGGNSLGIDPAAAAAGSYNDGECCITHMLIDAYQTADERAADGNPTATQTAFPPYLANDFPAAVRSDIATDISLAVRGGLGTDQVVALTSVGDAPAGTAIIVAQDGSQVLHIPAGGSGTISGVVLSITDSRFKGAAAVSIAVPDVTIVQSLAVSDDLTTPNDQPQALEQRPHWQQTAGPAGEFVATGDGALSVVISAQGAVVVDTGQANHRVRGKVGANAPAAFVTVRHTDPSNCVFVLMTYSSFVIYSRVAGQQNQIAQGNMPSSPGADFEVRHHDGGMIEFFLNGQGIWGVQIPAGELPSASNKGGIMIDGGTQARTFVAPLVVEPF